MTKIHELAAKIISSRDTVRMLDLSEMGVKLAEVVVAEKGEAVAWVKYVGYNQWIECPGLSLLKAGTKLYTHPSRSLTDEEIYAVWNDDPVVFRHMPAHMMDFAHALIAKLEEQS